MYPTAPPRPQTSFPVMSMVFGIVGIVISFIPCFTLFAWISDLAALILGGIDLNYSHQQRTAYNNQSVTGCVLGGLGLAINLYIWSAFISFSR